MEINTSPNVSNFDFDALLDISTATAKAVLTDISTYISGGQANIIGINFKIIDPNNITFHETIYPPDIDLTPGLTDYEVNLPSFNGAVKWGVYKIYATLIDQDGTQYEWTENGLNYKAIRLCKPNTLVGATGNFGGMQLLSDFDCDTNTLLVEDGTAYVYNGVAAAETDTDVTVTYPVDPTGTPSYQTSTFMPFTLPISLSGVYSITALVIQTYDYTETTHVKVAYKYQKSTDVQCGFTLCKALCEYERLAEDIQNCVFKSVAETQEKQKQFLLISGKLVKLLSFGKHCGKSFNTATVLEEIRVIGNFTCDCDCTPAAIVPLPVYAHNTIVKGSMCGDIDMVLQQVGSSVLINLSDVHYDIQVDESISDWVTFTPVDDGCNKTWNVNIDFCAAVEALGCGGGGGSGTVTDFSAGNLSPLFTTSVATSTTTPALTFNANNAAAGTWFGNNTGGATPASFNAAAALTKTDDTNVTLTFGGSPTTALLNATSLTLGWAGVLSLARGGTNKALVASNGAIVYSDADSLELSAVGVSGQVLTSGGAGAPTWSTLGSVAWLLAGNATGNDTSFLGTTTNNDFLFKTDNTTRAAFFKTGELGIGITASPLGTLHIEGNGQSPLYARNAATSQSFEFRDSGQIYRNGSLYSRVGGTTITTWGYNAGLVTSGINGTFIGYNAGLANTTATQNTFVGESSGLVNTTGVSNSFFGRASGMANTTGLQQTFLGTSAGLVMVSGNGNVFVGYHAGNSYLSGDVNVVIGKDAGRHFVSGIASGSYTGNILLGCSVADGMTSGDWNIFLGTQTGKNAITANRNIVIGNAMPATAYSYGDVPNTFSASSISDSLGFGTGITITASNQILFGSLTYYYNNVRHIYSGTGEHNTYFLTATPESAQVGTFGDITYVNTGAAGQVFVKATGSATNTGWLQLLTSGSVSGSGIDDVLAVGQALTTNRTLTGLSQNLTFDLASWELITSSTASIRANTTDVFFGGLDTGVYAQANENMFQVTDQSLIAYLYVEPAANVAYFRARQATILGKRFEIDGASGSVLLGDVQNLNNGTLISIIDKTDEAITYNANLGHTFNGVGVTINGKLTVTGAIDPTHLYLDEQSGDPSNVANKGILYTRDRSTITELFYMDSAGIATQITNGGVINGANTALSNLGTVNINTSLLAQTGVDLGSTTKPFRDIYIFGAGTYATTYLKLTGTPTGTRTITFPDSTGTVLTTATAITTAQGGTGIASYSVGDILYASGATTLSKLADVAVGSYLRSGGVTTAPLWSTLILPNAATSGRLVYASATNTYGESANLTFATATLTIGVAGAATGILALTGVTSGTALLTVASAAGTPTITLPGVTGTLATLAGTETLTNKSIVATQLTGTAYTFAANNTNGTSAYTLQSYEDHNLADYAGTLAWNGTPPGTIVSQKYAWSRIGNTVTLFISVLYTSTGTTNTTVTFTMPSDCPNPAVIANSGDAASEYMYPMNGARVEVAQTTNPSAVRGGIRRNAGDTAFEIALIFGSTSALLAQVTVIYRTA